MPTQKEIWDAWKAPETLEECVALLFEIIDSKEISDEGREFRPTYITSCRVWDSHRLGKLLPKMREIVIKDNPYQHYYGMNKPID